MPSPIPNAQKFTTETARAAGMNGAKKTNATISIKKSMVAAANAYVGRASKELLAQARVFAEDNDNLGLTVFFLEHMCGGGEDRRAMLAGFMKMLPIEVQGALDASLTVKVMTMVGDREIDITRVKEPPKDAVRAAVPALLPHHAPEVEVDV